MSSGPTIHRHSRGSGVSRRRVAPVVGCPLKCGGGSTHRSLRHPPSLPGRPAHFRGPPGPSGHPTQPARPGLGSDRDAKSRRRRFRSYTGRGSPPAPRPLPPPQRRDHGPSRRRRFDGRAVAACAGSARLGGTDGSRGRRTFHPGQEVPIIQHDTKLLLHERV